MKRIRIYSPGAYDKLIIEKNVPIPKPGKGQVLVRTHAVGVNYADVCVRMGLYSSAKKYVGWPITLGFEFSGTVVEIGPDEDIHNTNDSNSENNNNNKVDILKKRGIEVGSQVFGVSRFDAYSTHVVVPKHQLLPLPKSLSMEEAAAMPAVFFTAYYAMFELGHPRPGQNILVHSAAGGVGGALVQLGKLAGANVVAVVGSSHKVAAVRQLGADHIIDKSTQKLWQECEKICPDGFDLVFDANGVETMKQSYNHLTTGGGKLVIYGFHSMLPRQGGTPNWFKMTWDWLWTPTFNPLQMTSDNKSVMAFNLSYLFHKVELFSEMMERLVQLFEEGKLKSSKITSYSLDEVAEAHKAIESGKTIGKLILLTSDE